MNSEDSQHNLTRFFFGGGRGGTREVGVTMWD